MMIHPQCWPRVPQSPAKSGPDKASTQCATMCAIYYYNRLQNNYRLYMQIIANTSSVIV